MRITQKWLKLYWSIITATNGFFAGVETRSNAAVVRAYRVVLEELTQETVNKIDKIEPIKE